MLQMIQYEQLHVSNEQWFVLLWWNEL